MSKCDELLPNRPDEKFWANYWFRSQFFSMGISSIFHIVLRASGAYHTIPVFGQLPLFFGQLKKRSVCMQSAFLLFWCCDEKSMHANLSTSSDWKSMIAWLSDTIEKFDHLPSDCIAWEPDIIEKFSHLHWVKCKLPEIFDPIELVWK